MRTSAGMVQKALFCLSLLGLAWMIVRVSTSPLGLMAQYLPDDAFYYNEVAWNLARHGVSSADGGLTTTTGYHPLWAWLCEFLARFAGPSPMTLLREMIVTSGVLSFGVALAAGWYAWRRSLLLLSVLCVAVSSFSFLGNSVSAMEWSLVIAISAVTFLTLVFAASGRLHPAFAVTALFVLGLLGSLARTDFGVQMLSYLIAAIAVRFLFGQGQFLLPSLSGLAGACAGLGLTFYHSYHATGKLLQGSVRMKALWSSAGGHSPLQFFPVLARTVLYAPFPLRTGYRMVLAIQHLPHSRLIMAATTIALLLALAACLGLLLILWTSAQRRQSGLVTPLPLFLLLSASFTIFLYAIVDAFNTFGLNLWYSSQITVAVLILIYFALKGTVSSGRQALAQRLLTAVITANLICFAFTGAVSGPYTQQRWAVLAGEAIKTSLPHERIGFSDSGIINFAYGGNIINLDGMMNDEIVEYAPGHLPCYLIDKNIHYFNGFGSLSEQQFSMPSPAHYATVVDVSIAGKTWHLYQPDAPRIRALFHCDGEHKISEASLAP